MLALFECTVWPALTHHFLAVCIQGVIDNPLGGVLLMVVLEAQVPEALRNRLKSLSFWLVPERIVGIGTVDDLAEQYQCRVAREIILLEDCFKRAFFAVMPKF